ncbi:hypothetical protein HZH68_005492 [Vespula germanica]|uniref:Uncharacterized protein n=1 Tax=Vespula germanica TaxID=30212 RepID=A0A834KG81_VESGE|nr:hypothetical protein HZH68_005492 [Vespula germanica]
MDTFQGNESREKSNLNLRKVESISYQVSRLLCFVLFWSGLVWSVLVWSGLFLSHTTYRANEVLIQLSYSPGHSDISAFGCFGSNENIAVISGILREEVEAPTVKNFNQTR